MVLDAGWVGTVGSASPRFSSIAWICVHRLFASKIILLVSKTVRTSSRFVSFPEGAFLDDSLKQGGIRLGQTLFHAFSEMGKVTDNGRCGACTDDRTRGGIICLSVSTSRRCARRRFLLSFRLLLSFRHIGIDDGALHRLELIEFP